MFSRNQGRSATLMGVPSYNLGPAQAVVSWSVANEPVRRGLRCNRELQSFFDPVKAIHQEGCPVVQRS